MVKIGIIGVGNQGGGYTKILYEDKAVEGAVLTAVCDTNPKRLDWVVERFDEGFERYASNEEFFDKADVDAIIITTPHYAHPTIASEALKRGIHVLVEKPAGVYTKAVREMNEIAEKSGKIFAIMFNQRTNPVYAKLREIIRAGELGEIRRMNWICTSWYRSQSYYDSGGWRATWAGEGGGVLLNQCPHQLDLWQWTTGLMPSRIRAFSYNGKYHDIEVEDDVTAYAEYDNGATGVFVTTTGEWPGSNRLEVTGDRGKILVEDQEIKFWRLTETEQEFSKRYKGGFGSPEFWECKISPTGAETGHTGIMQNFVNAISKGEKLLAPGAEGIKSLSLSNAMHLSSWTDDWVSLPIDEEKFLHFLNEKRKASRGKDVNDVMLDTRGTY